MTITKSLSIFKRKNIDMTEGSIVKNIIMFAIPLLIGNLFQQLYNMVDTWVIGQTGQNEAYAAVGSIGPIINILIGFFSGLATGAGVVISQYYGAKEEDKVKKAVHTSIAMTLVMAVVFTIVGMILAPVMVQLMLHEDGGANSIYQNAKTYLTIYFAGVIGLMLFNMGSGILRAIGDSQRPFYFIIVSALTNTLLDLLFVFKLDMGVVGVALATVIAQALSAILAIYTLLTTNTLVKLNFKSIKIDFPILKRIVNIGIPAALQMALTSFSNVFVQSYIANVNGDKTFCLGGWTSYSKVDQFVFLPVTSVALASTTFVGQNIGKRDIKRALKGTYIAYIIATISSASIMVPLMIFSGPISSVFNKSPEVIYYSTLLIKYITPFYLFTCVNQVFSGALRGLGNSKAPMFIMLSSFVLIRQIYLYIVTNYISNEIIPVAISYPVGWGCCATFTLIYFFWYKNKKIKEFSN